MLQLRLLGKPRIALGGREEIKLSTRHAEALLYYLVTTGKPQLRSQITLLFWPEREESVGLKYLRDALYQLRQAVAPYLIVDRQTLAFDFNRPYWLDVEEFQALLAGSERATRAQALVEAVSLYRGEFLEGFHLNNADLLDTWLLREREKLHSSVVDGLHQLTEEYLRRSDYPAGLEANGRLLALEPWRETAHQQRMSMLVHLGRRGDALRQYETCRQVLDEQFGAKPAPETTTLYERIRSGEVSDLPRLVTQRQEPADSPLERAGRRSWPRPLTSFLGREEALTELAARLNDPEYPLLTVTGPVGVGKTRLAVAVAERAQASFPDGVWFIDLQALDAEPEQTAVVLAAAVAKTLDLRWEMFRTEDIAPRDGVPLNGGPRDGAPVDGVSVNGEPEDAEVEEVRLADTGLEDPGLEDSGLVEDRLATTDRGRPHPERPRSQGALPAVEHAVTRELQDHLQARRLLLILDGFERFLAAQKWLLKLLQAAPGLQILVTSRQRLGLQAEWVYPLSGLDYPPAAAAGPMNGQEPVTDLTDYDSIRLFVERARRAWPAFELTDENREAVMAICRQVGGLPLAIELAAAQLAVRPCSEIAAALSTDLSILTTDLADVAPHHRGLETVLAKSWALLAEEEAAVLVGCAIFRGPFTAEAAAAVAGATSRSLAGLVDKSFLLAGPGRRYRLPVIWHRWAAGELAGQPALQQEVEARHARFFVDYLACQAQPPRDAADERDPWGQAALQRGALRRERNGPNRWFQAATVDLADIEAACAWAIRTVNRELLARGLPILAAYYAAAAGRELPAPKEESHQAPSLARSGV